MLLLFQTCGQHSDYPKYRGTLAKVSSMSMTFIFLHLVADSAICDMRQTFDSKYSTGFGPRPCGGCLFLSYPSNHCSKTMTRAYDVDALSRRLHVRRDSPFGTTWVQK